MTLEDLHRAELRELRERVARLEEALREYADPSAWGRVVTKAGNREAVFLVMYEPPWEIARSALAGGEGDAT